MSNLSSHFHDDLPGISEPDFDEPEEGSGQNPEDVIDAQWHSNDDQSGDQSPSPQENDSNPSSDEWAQKKPDEYSDREQGDDYKEDESHSDYYDPEKYYYEPNDENQDGEVEEEEDNYNPVHQPAYIRNQEECWRRIEQSGAPLDADGFFRPRTVYEFHRYRHVLILQARLSQFHGLPPQLETTLSRRHGNVPPSAQRIQQRPRRRLVTLSCNGVSVARFRTHMAHGAV